MEDGDTTVFGGLTSGGGGHLRVSEVSSSMSGVSIARSAVPNDPDERVRAASIECGGEKQCRRCEWGGQRSVGRTTWAWRIFLVLVAHRAPRPGQVNRVRPDDATEMRCWGIAGCRFDVLLGKDRKDGNMIGRLTDDVGGIGQAIGGSG